VSRLGFRTRLFVILSLFALLPSLATTLVWWMTLREGLPLITANAAWDRVAATGERALATVRDSTRGAPLTPVQEAALRAHEDELSQSLLQARRFKFVADRIGPLILIAALGGVLLFAGVSSRVAGHLSRQLSRPTQELVGWTELLARGEPLPDSAVKKGAPEFEQLRAHMRSMAHELDLSRARAIEAERLRAFRETARQVAHELKNPLTPIRFAVDRLRREVPPHLNDVVDVLGVESQRLEEMARSFSAFGRLPEGPVAEVDLGELASYTARATVPPNVTLDLAVAEGVPMVRGHHEALARALSNVLINAVEACRGREDGRVSVSVAAEGANGDQCVHITVKDTGCGISTDQLARIWEPYVTNKPGGTGLGLAIARQTILAHRGSVSAESDVGRGTSVRFTIPADGVGSTGGRA
jgi:signal transduction histidine kinase